MQIGSATSSLRLGRLAATSETSFSTEKRPFRFAPNRQNLVIDHCEEVRSAGRAAARRTVERAAPIVTVAAPSSRGSAGLFRA